MRTARLVLATLLLAILPAIAQEVPRWEGIEKTEKMLAADAEFVETVRAYPGGFAAGAQQAIKLGWEAVGRGEPDLSIQRCNQAFLLEPERPDIAWCYAIATHVRGDPLSEVERWFDEVEERLPEVAALKSDRGRILDERGKPKRALTYFQKALALDPDHREALIGLARVSKQLGDERTAQDAMERLGASQ